MKNVTHTKQLRTLLLLLTLCVCPAIIASGIESELPLIKELERGITEAFGDSFEFVRGIRVRSDQIPVYQVSIGERWNEIWFAELRAKQVGEFGLSYSVERPASVSKQGWTVGGQTYRFIAPVNIHSTGTRRFLQLWSAGTFEDGGALQNPQANVGDIVVLPVCSDQKITNYKFRLLTREDREVDSFIGVREYAMPTAAKAMDPHLVTVENAAESPIQVIQSGIRAGTDQTLTMFHYDISARLEFSKTGDFNLSGQLTVPPTNEINALGGMLPGMPGRRVSPKSYPFHVVAKEVPIRVILGEILYTESHGGSRPVKSSGTCEIPWGTWETRVGDQLAMECGSYVVPATKKNTTKRGATIKVQPFKPVEAYPTSMK